MVDLDQLRSALAEVAGNRLRYDFEMSIVLDAARLYLAEHEGPPPAPYDIEIPDFVNRNSMGW